MIVMVTAAPQLNVIPLLLLSTAYCLRADCTPLADCRYFWDHKQVLPQSLLCIAEAFDDYHTGLGPAQCSTADFSYCGRRRFKPWHSGDPPTLPGEFCRRPAGRLFRAYVTGWRVLRDLAHDFATATAPATAVADAAAPLSAQ